MSRTSSQKRIYYARAVFVAGNKVPGNLESMIRKALKGRTMSKTEIEVGSVGTMTVRQREVMSADYVCLAIGVGVDGESMATMGHKAATINDKNQPEKAPKGRVFKLADSFCLIDKNEVVFCNDGGMSRAALEAYLRGLVGKANLGASSVAFGLVSRLDQDKARTLAEEGVKEIHIEAASYAASQAIAAAKKKKKGGDGLAGGFGLVEGFGKLWQGVREEFLEEADTPAERDAISNKYDELNLTTIISVKKGSRGEPIMFEALQKVAQDVMDDAPAGADVSVMTTKGNFIGATTLTLSAVKSIKRFAKQNDLDFTDAWNKLAEFRKELADSKRWKV